MSPIADSASQGASRLTRPVNPGNLPPVHYDRVALGYLLCAVAYAALLGVCLTLWRRRLAGSGFAAAIAAQLGWSALLGAQAAGAPIQAGLAITAEYLRDLAWMLVLVRCLRGADASGTTRAVQRALGALAAVVIVAGGLTLWPDHSGFISRQIERYWLWGGFLLSIGGLVLVEQAARNTRSTQRWALKYVWLALGALFAWDLCFFSIGMLRGSLAGVFWADRGIVDAVLAGLLAVGFSRIEEWESAAFLPPRIVFFSATLLGAAMYVFVMAVGSLLVRRLGGSWGEAGQMLFLGAGALVLAVAALSEQFRAWSRVTIAKYFFPYRYAYRREWQKLTRALSVGGQTPIYERIAQVMAGFMSSPYGGLWLKDAEGGLGPAGGELAPPSAPRESGHAEFFDYLLRNEWICDLDEARSPRRGKPVPAPPRWMLENPRLWLVVPLICESAMVGFVLIAQPLAAVRLSWEELDLLKAAGRQVASYLAFEQAAKRLAEAHQFEALNRLSAVLMHDLRHLIAQQALVVQNAARHRGNPEFFDDAILTIDNSVKRMTRLMDELRSGVLTEQTHRVPVAELCAEAIRRCAGQPRPTLEVHERVEAVLNRERLLQVLEHLIRNAQEATPADGSVTVRVQRSGQQALIEVADTGCGMDEAFVRHKLFAPFETTKGEKGFGIGAYQAREFVRKCGGTIEVESRPGRGTRFSIRLPLAPALSRTEGEAPNDELQTH